ncbi:3-hydroxyacyl-CoA dehydrogenase family protein [Ectobacillus ponti]|uniref:3-hydroxyacyl-CoA dehydrogenase family protein n=1 Tax=Ectobacillus ponti TaxID=2961894 RepID=A0AA41X5L2_9BACI|nr:3-hydroxyacyl-CoA dehydrogenase family protein [Ectobacillus ponti]MCP8967069.1 3-hydroxyacyl-CoA dehydrogenase family protein [Ectobacillus ponti]
MMREQLAVLGCGTMGHSIALAAAMTGFETMVWGTTEADIVRGQTGVAEKLAVLQAHGFFPAAEIAEIQKRVTFTLSLEECVADRTFIIEAVPEILELKQELYEKLDVLCPPDVILASNTSGLSPTAIAARMERPERMVVTHFWNPGHLVPLVEIVRGERTGEGAVKRSLSLLQQMKKQPIVVQKDVPGFIANRLQYALLREAHALYEQGVASAEEIDIAVRYSIGRRLSATGPFMSADMGGLDVIHTISSYLIPDLSTQPSLPSMGQLVAEGKYGQKNGAGFYEWTPELHERMNSERESELIRLLKQDFERELV